MAISCPPYGCKNVPRNYSSNHNRQVHEQGRCSCECHTQMTTLEQVMERLDTPPKPVAPEPPEPPQTLVDRVVAGLQDEETERRLEELRSMKGDEIARIVAHGPNAEGDFLIRIHSQDRSIAQEVVCTTNDLDRELKSVYRAMMDTYDEWTCNRELESNQRAEGPPCR